jgi:hypothetical protein
MEKPGQYEASGSDAARVTKDLQERMKKFDKNDPRMAELQR